MAEGREKEKAAAKTSKPSRIPIPKYTLGEELISAISHGIGAGLGIAALVLCVVVSAKHHNAYAVVSSAIYGTSLILLYTMSTIYHALVPCKGKRVLRVIDHCSVFLLIAGTYTPFALVALNGATGWVLFGIVWGVSIIGITLNAIDVERFKVPSMVAYLAMGWVIILKLKDLLEVMPKNGIILLIAGGIAYTVGAIIYGIGSKVKYMHSVWHFFVLAGSILHFFSILFYVI